jgi:DNA-binding transcriptional MerR regulator
MSTNTPDELISTNEAARILKISPRTVMRYRERGMFPYIQFSKRTFLYKKKDILLFVESHVHLSKNYSE